MKQPGPTIGQTGSAVLQPNFKPRGYKRVEGKVYRDLRSSEAAPRFAIRIRVNGSETWRKLDAPTLKSALIEAGRKLANQAKAKALDIPDPFLKNLNLTLNQISAPYIAAHCPKNNRKARVGKQLTDQITHLEKVLAYLGRRPWDKITNDDLTNYHKVRTAEITAKYPVDPTSPTLQRTGDRIVELELDALMSLFKWALLHPGKTGVNHIPISRMRFRDPGKIRRCRKVQPASGDELHLLMRSLLEETRSEPLAWQMGYEAFTGLRTHEALELRMDARSKLDPGYIEYKTVRGKQVMHRFWHPRSDTHKGTFQYTEISPAFASFLEAHHNWHARRFPSSPLAIPNLDDPDRPADVSSLTHTLRKKCIEFDLRNPDGSPRLVTSHGVRSMSINAWRSIRDADGVPKFSDDEIALRHGQKSGGKLIVEVYGEIGDPLSLMPSDPRNIAWLKWLPKTELQLELGI